MALANGFADMKRTWTCGGSWDGWGTGQEQMCWNHSGHGTLDLRGGIVQSCDVVFHTITHDFLNQAPFPTIRRRRRAIPLCRTISRNFHFDQYTGIDLGGESVGVIPTPEWKAEHFRNTPEEAVWKGGDMTNMIIGQGYVLVTPLQVAVAYGAVATGKLLKPHLLKEVRNASGDVAATRKVETAGGSTSRRTWPSCDALNGVATDRADVLKLLGRQGIDPATVAWNPGAAGTPTWPTPPGSPATRRWTIPVRGDLRGRARRRRFGRGRPARREGAGGGARERCRCRGGIRRRHGRGRRIPGKSLRGAGAATSGGHAD